MFAASFLGPNVAGPMATAQGAPKEPPAAPAPVPQPGGYATLPAWFPRTIVYLAWQDGLIIKPKEAGVSVLETDLPVMFLKAAAGGYDIGYLCASHGVFYRWRELRIPKEQAAKRFPSYVQNALSVQEQKLAVLDIEAAEELKAGYEPKPGPVGATRKDE